MFWWYWSVRRRLLVLAVVVAPLLVFVGLRAFSGGGEESPSAEVTSSVTANDPVSGSTSGSGQIVDAAALALEVRDDESRSAASVFPVAFGEFPSEVVQTRNLVFPGMAPDEYSFYVFVGYGTPGESGAAPAATDASTTTVATTVPPATTGSAAEDVLDRLTAHFRGVGALAEERESRTGTQLEVTGIEAGRGYRTTLNFLEVPGGVVVRGVVLRVPANEVADLLEAAAPVAGAPAAAETGEGSDGDSAGDEPAAATTVP